MTEKVKVLYETYRYPVKAGREFNDLINGCTTWIVLPRTEAITRHQKHITL